MAKVKTAKQRITDYFKAKGLDAAEIKDAFDELDTADADLDRLAGELTQYKTTNDGWATFWNETATPAFTKLQGEKEALDAQIAKLKAAGIQIGDLKVETPEPKGSNQYVTAEQLKQFQSEITNGASAVMKALTKVSLKHFRTFNEEADLDALEKLMAEGKARDVDDAYRVWSEPKYETLRKGDEQKRIDDGVKKGIQDALSKQGISMRRKPKGDEVEHEELAKTAGQKNYKDLSPEEKRTYDNGLKDAFINDINTLT